MDKITASKETMITRYYMFIKSTVDFHEKPEFLANVADPFIPFVCCYNYNLLHCRLCVTFLYVALYVLYRI